VTIFTRPHIRRLARESQHPWELYSLNCYCVLKLYNQSRAEVVVRLILYAPQLKGFNYKAHTIFYETNRKSILWLVFLSQGQDFFERHPLKSPYKPGLSTLVQLSENRFIPNLRLGYLLVKYNWMNLYLLKFYCCYYLADWQCFDLNGHCQEIFILKRSPLFYNDF